MIADFPDTAVILAAGQGTRLLPYTKDHPKCMLPFDGVPLISLQIRCFLMCGIERIVVVTGYGSEVVEDWLGDSVEYVHNADFQTTSSMYSLWLGLSKVDKGCFILNSDVLFHPEILRRLATDPHSEALAMDFDAHLNEEEMKVKVEGSRVVALSKSLRDGHGENVGLLKFSAYGKQRLQETIGLLLEQGFRKEMVPFAVDRLAAEMYIEAVPVAGLPWIEIDFPEDYERALNEIFPRIRGDIAGFEVDRRWPKYP
ncbi:NTP transferase domain-containing protein [Thermodesulforhabdus norvegica]|uniref:Choline kinase n=1 Tax=Thermodesulforhabdus norvegica TaxID=39841 RepID=A0A1I4SJL3_9BACT|nr:phosphocholine cytidylyltransferase family protein [Thermodesulforhabdus norvegica]SFM64622.1 Choline kinase [Thermodesulforhabdus norvegica]